MRETFKYSYIHIYMYMTECSYCKAASEGENCGDCAFLVKVILGPGEKEMKKEALDKLISRVRGDFNEK